MIDINKGNLSESIWSELLDETHDRYFDLTQASYSKKKKEFQLYLGEKRNGPYDEKVLRVQGVHRAQIRDESKTQIYMLFSSEIDINKLMLKLPGAGIDIYLSLKDDWEINLSKHSKLQEWEIIVK